MDAWVDESESFQIQSLHYADLQIKIILLKTLVQTITYRISLKRIEEAKRIDDILSLTFFDLSFYHHCKFFLTKLQNKKYIHII